MLQGGNFRYYLFSLANLIAAFGGGLILGKGIGVINIEYLKGGSILAFFIGTILGLVFLQLIPKRWSNFFSQYFSLGCCLTSIILFFLFKNYAANNQMNEGMGLVFFLLLCVRFSFWFYSRVKRASVTASSQKSIAWVEMGYYLGMVLGLVIWNLLKVNPDLGTALIIDASLQLIAGLLDFKSKLTQDLKPNDRSASQVSEAIQESKLHWCWRLSGAVLFLTLAIQVILFSISHEVSPELSSYLIALFYLGVAAAALFCSFYKMELSWGHETHLAYVYSATQVHLKLKLSYLLFVSLFAVFLVVHCVQFRSIPIYMMYLFSFIAAFIFEILSIVLLDRIGFEERQIEPANMIMKTYGLMGIAAALGFWLFGFLGAMYQNALIVLISCIVFFNSLVTRRVDERTFEARIS